MAHDRRSFLRAAAALVVVPSIAPAITPSPEIAFTAGGFADFGRGTLVMLHGGEAVVPFDLVSHAERGCERLIAEVDRLVAALLEIPPGTSE